MSPDRAGQMEPLEETAWVPVWPWSVRLGHGVLAASVLTCLVAYEGGAWHERLGYAALAVALWRLLMGFASRDAFVAFAGFVRGPRATLHYLARLIARREPHHLGHNPLGAWMIVALLATAVVAAASGALYVTDRFWGEPWLIAVHAAAGWTLAVLVPLHLAGVVLTSWRQRENLVAAMLHGRKRTPGCHVDAATGRR